MSIEMLALIFFAIGILWYIWRNIRGSYHHLDDDDIRQFLEGRMSKKDERETREHLLQCPECKARMDEIQKEAKRMAPDRWLKRRF
jgi:hypothetical protein